MATPDEFFDGLHKFSSPVVAYDAALGNKNLIEEWTKLLNDQYNIDVTGDQMLITAGSSEALMFVFSICCDTNDEVLVVSPSYANYSGFAAIAGVSLVPIECDIDSSFLLPSSKEKIEWNITSKTKAILMCSPNNPTGTTFSDEEIKLLLDICEKHDLLLIVDEVYREFVYDNASPRSAFQVSPKNPRLVVLDSFSKRYSLCGARVGCIISWNKEFMLAAANFASTRVSAPSIEQFAAAHMLKNISSQYLSDAVREYNERRDVLVSGLKQIAGVEFVVPQGGFYVLAKLPVASSANFAQFMLRDFSLNGETVWIAPANGFFLGTDKGASYARIAFVASQDDLQRATKILEYALSVYAISNENTSY
jgi:aspartate aminotransferase